MRGSGGGRPPKPEGQKRHRNPVTKDAIVIPNDARVAVVPEPSFPLEGLRRIVWDKMWDTPVAVLWSHADVASLTRLVVLQTSKEALAVRGVLAEIRQLEDRFLLNPYARAQQRVVIEDPSAADDSAEVTSDASNVHQLYGT